MGKHCQFYYFPLECGTRQEYLALSKPKHLHVPMEGIKLLPASIVPSAFTNNHTLEFMIVERRKIDFPKFVLCMQMLTLTVLG